MRSRIDIAGRRLLSQGRYIQADPLWRAALDRVGELSRKHTPSLLPRCLHVASAVELNLRYFVTFDVRQQRLARAVGLKLIIPS